MIDNHALSSGLMFVHGNLPEDLRDLLVMWIKRYPLAPLEKEIILVQSNGIAQWLKLALAEDADNGGCGIAAALEISLPSSFFWRIYRALLGHDAVPKVSPFDKTRMVWRLLRLFAAPMSQIHFAPLVRFLENDDDLRKRFQLAECISDLFDQYQVYRADWLVSWMQGDDILNDTNGNRIPIPNEQHWQAILWRMLIADVAKDPSFSPNSNAHYGRALVHETFMQRAAHWPNTKRPAGLPRRVIIFGVSTLPRQSLEVLAVLARWSQILMYVHNPCAFYWGDIVTPSPRQQRRVSDADLPQHAHPLLAMWGKQGRDFISMLNEYDSNANHATNSRPSNIDVFNSPGHTTLLQQLQDDILNLRTVSETRQHWPAVDATQDLSIRFHIAHSPQREIEILHDQLLAAFNADPTLHPREIIIMLPEVDSYAPHIQAVFGLYDHQDPRYIPFTLVDRGRLHFDRLLHALEKLIALPQSRLTISDVFDLLDVPALRRRFGITQADLPVLQRWIVGANIRWGLNAVHRASFGLPEHEQNTWLFGLRRMLLGYAVGMDANIWRDIEPYDEIGGLDAALLGPLVQLLESLEATWSQCRVPTTVAVWCVRLRALMADFFIADQTADAYTLLQLEHALQLWQENCDEARLTEVLPLSVVGNYWLSQIDQDQIAQRFFVGTVTFATLMPMRAIPFRQVYLLGMNDGNYPRAHVPLDFDLMNNYYRPGDRARREDDRYLFLEALLSARERIYISWVGRSVHDNSLRPPSVLVTQLRDHLQAGWQLSETASDLLTALTIEHHLQPFSSAYFPLLPNTSPLFTYAHEWRHEEETLTNKFALVEQLLPPLIREEPLALRELTEFLKYPVKAFFHQRLNISLEIGESTIVDQEPFGIDGLEKWQLQNELIIAQNIALTHDADIVRACQTRLARIQGRGALAWCEFGQAMANDLTEPMPSLFVRYQDALNRWPQLIDSEDRIQFKIALAGQSLEIVDWLGNLRAKQNGAYGQVILEPSEIYKYDEYQYQKLIGHWIKHVFAQLHRPMTTEIISKHGDMSLPPLISETAQEYLTTLLTAWWHGMRQPLPLATKTAFKWLTTSDSEKARVIYEGNDYGLMGEVTTSEYLQRVYPDFVSIFTSADGQFVRLAETLLRPLLNIAEPAIDTAKVKTSKNVRRK